MNRELVDRPTPEYWFFFPELAKHWMSGTQVEQMTGRSGNKKWKCSIAIGNFKVEKWEKADVGVNVECAFLASSTSHGPHHTPACI